MTQENIIPHNLLDNRINDRGFFERILSEREKIEEEREKRLDERFLAQEKANQLKSEELARRLDVLNHAHEQAREKEASFIGREAFESHVQRNLDDHITQRREVTTTAQTLSEKVETTQKALAEKVDSAQGALAHALAEQQKTSNDRISKLENFQAKILGLALATPFVSALIVYLITKS